MYLYKKHVVMPRQPDPRYRQIYDDLEQRIGSGSYLPGMKIDSEPQLAAAWSCSRHTVRKALLALAERGLLQQRPGRGWFVSNKKVHVRSGAQILFDGWQPKKHIRELCQDHGYQLSPLNEQLQDRQTLLSEICNDPDILGVVKVDMRGQDQAFIRELQQNKKHVVLIGLAEPSICDVISLDFFRASFDMVTHAINKGHRHIGFFGRHLHEEMPPFKRRVEGYRYACQFYDIPNYEFITPRELYLANDVSKWNAQQLAQNADISCCILDSQATAQCLDAFSQIKSIPEELIVGGYGNGRLHYGQHLPIKSFDAIYEAWDDLHEIAIRRMLDRLDGDKSRPSYTVVPCDFIKGDTGLF